MTNLDFLNPQNFESTEFILRHNYTISTDTVPVTDYHHLRCKVNEKYGVVDTLVTYDTPLHCWMNKNIFIESRLYDCVGSTEFVDSDPIMSLFDCPLKYVGFVYDPHTSPGFAGIADPTMITSLFSCKFGNGTPQTYLTDNLIIGWVMYYDFGDTLWILEVQANNRLRGGILQTPAGRTQFYRHLLTRFVNATSTRKHILLSITDMIAFNKLLRVGESLPPISPYSKKVLSSAGFKKHDVVNNVHQLGINVPSRFSQPFTPWIRLPSA